MWFDHLEVVQEHRRGGAKKAAETRRRNKEAKEAKIRISLINVKTT
jgi:hypothetical protein